jgi:thioesterase domain-containing protein
MWLAGFLPENSLIAPMNPRVSTFGYDAAMFAMSKSVSTVREYACQLLNELRRFQNETRSAGTPIFFIAHSLGGIIAKEVR